MKRIAAASGGALFLLSCALVRGGLFDHHRYGDVALYGHYAHEMTSGHWPYRDFYDEYPVLAQPLFAFVRILPGPFATSFKWLMAACGVAAIVLMVSMMRESAGRLAAAVTVAGLSPLLMGPVFLNTYDLFPALLTVAAVAAFVAGRERTTLVLLALAIAAKIYPVAIAPIVLYEAWTRGALRRAVAWLAGVLVLVHLPFAVMGPGGLRFSYWLQVKRDLESESLGGGILLVLDRLGIHSVTLARPGAGLTRCRRHARRCRRRHLDPARDRSDRPRHLALYPRRARPSRRLCGGRHRVRRIREGAFAPVPHLARAARAREPGSRRPARSPSPSCSPTSSGTASSRPHGSVENWGRVLGPWILVRDLVLVGLFAMLAFRLRAEATLRSRR